MNFVKSILAREGNSSIFSGKNYNVTSRGEYSQTGKTHGVTRDEAKSKLRDLLGNNNEIALKNNNDGEEVRLSRTSIRKMTSDKAVDKSVANGFTKEEHFAVFSDIDNLFKKSLKVAEHPDAKNSN